MVPRTMLRRIKELSKDDIEALLNFYASKGMTYERKTGIEIFSATDEIRSSQKKICPFFFLKN
jgi:hypothetical protein